MTQRRRMSRAAVERTPGREVRPGVRAPDPRDYDAPGVSLTMTCDAVPVQIEGEVDGLGMYFRARGGVWRCTIARTVGDAVGRGPHVFVAEGADPAHGYMTHDEAWRIVSACIAGWRGRVLVAWLIGRWRR